MFIPNACATASRSPPSGAAAPDGPQAPYHTIRVLRFNAGEMTQAELGEKIGVARQTVAAIEQGKYSPPLETALPIADVFGVQFDEVFRWAEK